MKRTKTDWKLVALFGLLLLIAGTAGFMTFKQESLFDAFYQTALIMISHFYHVIDESLATKLLIIGLMLGGTIFVAYLIKWFVEYIIEGELKGGFTRRRMDRRINSLIDHYIITGMGRVGWHVAHELATEGAPFVVIDEDPRVIERAKEQGWLYLEGSAAKDSVLEAAGVRRAKTLVIATGSDADNVFIALGARALAPEIFIVARANSIQAQDKLKKAGANRVAMPQRIGGYHMATMAMRPAVVDFLDVIVDNKHREIQVEEIMIQAHSPLVGKPISAYLSRKKTGTAVLAINRTGREPLINPDGDDLITAGDRLIVMGTHEQLETVARMA
jgi:voltage-gated potassium channel